MNKKQGVFVGLIALLFFHLMVWENSVSVGITYFESLVAFIIAIAIIISVFAFGVWFYDKLGDS